VKREFKSDDTNISNFTVAYKLIWSIMEHNNGLSFRIVILFLKSCKLDFASFVTSEFKKPLIFIPTPSLILFLHRKQNGHSQ